MGHVLTDFDRDLLRSMNGEKIEGLAWGAAMGEAVEFLHECGLVTRIWRDGALVYVPTDAGRAAIGA